MGWSLVWLLAMALILAERAIAQEVEQSMAGHEHHAHHTHHNMRMDMDGAVMNENTDQLPRDCPRIAGEHEIVVRAGKQYAHRFNGTMFAFDHNEWQVAPCTRVKVTLINEDQVRHQWMVHGLPRYLYPEGMFHLEVNGQKSKTGVFIVSSAQKTYLVHCDVAQHMEKGMKAQLKVGGGDGDLPSVPGLTGPREPDAYAVRWSWSGVGVALVGMIVGVVLALRGLGRLL